MNNEAELSREFIDALREVLGLRPLYSEEKPSNLWDAFPRFEGNRRVEAVRRVDNVVFERW